MPNSTSVPFSCNQAFLQVGPWVRRGLQRIVRIFLPFGSTRRVLFGPARGCRYIVQPSMGLSYLLGRVDTARFLARHIRPSQVVYDVGANRGHCMLPFARFVGPRGRVVCFEPVKEIASVLERNRVLNGFDNVEIRMSALARQTGTTTFAFSPKADTCGKLDSVEKTYCVDAAEIRTVDTEALDELVADDEIPPPEVIKIDVEGGAKEVLEGAISVLRTHSPDIYIELHGPEEQEAVQKILGGLAYVFERTDGTRVNDVVSKWESPLWCHRMK